jgi:hypothetical protein
LISPLAGTSQICHSAPGNITFARARVKLLSTLSVTAQKANCQNENILTIRFFSFASLRAGIK